MPIKSFAAVCVGLRFLRNANSELQGKCINWMKTLAATFRTRWRAMMLIVNCLKGSVQNTFARSAFGFTCPVCAEWVLVVASEQVNAIVSADAYFIAKTASCS